jgi:hypothetical protein
MRRSSASQSANQAQFDFAKSDEPSSEWQGFADDEGASANRSREGATTSVSGPEFNVSPDLYALASKRAGRVNAASVPDNEVRDLLDERQRLLERFFDGTLTRREEIRLQYVRWNLDRIEDARFGVDLDAIEGYVIEYERLRDQVEKLSEELGKNQKGARRERREK